MPHFARLEMMLRETVVRTIVRRTRARSGVAAIAAAAFALTLAFCGIAAPPSARMTQAASSPAARFAAYGHPGAFLLRRDGRPTQIAHGADLADAPRRPASTFKVLLALIALDSGALRGADESVPWDGRPYPNHREWERDMALREAMQTSSEAYFRTLATRIGRERLAAQIAKVGYGNGRIGASARDAWHDGVLTVTPRQQLEFIDRLRRGDLPFRPAHIAAVKTAMRDDDGGVRVYAKTGTHLGDDGTGNAWWIGWVEGPQGATSFALSIDLGKADDRAARIALGKRLLRDAGAWPAR